MNIYVDDFAEDDKVLSEGLSEKDAAELDLIVQELKVQFWPLSSVELRTKSKDNSAFNGVINKLHNDELICELNALGYKTRFTGPETFEIYGSKR